MKKNNLLKQQIEYYRARASEYDDWFMKKGRYDQGEQLNNQWFLEVEELKQELRKFNPQGEVLELACGTGWWTEELVKYADRITAVDSSSEVIAINQNKLSKNRNKVIFIKADLFTWQPDKKYDAVFFSFWLSHVPPERFEQFWELVRSALKPHGQLFFIDNLKSGNTFSKNNQEEHTSLRELKDGRQFTIVKVYYKEEELVKKLRKLGWRVTVKSTDSNFIYGFGTLWDKA